MNGLASLNGKIVPIAEAMIPLADRGLLYGDGVFEGIRFINGKVLFHHEHMERLYESAEKIRLAIPDRSVYQTNLRELLKALDFKDGYLRIIVTRGVSDMGIRPNSGNVGQLYMIATTINLFPEELYQNGVPVIFAKTRKIPKESFDCSVKSLCYLSNIMGMWEAVEHNCLEAIMLTTEGVVSEATVSNVFVVKGKDIFTPTTATNCLVGITRNKIMEIAKSQGFAVLESLLKPDDLLKADEVFLTGTGAGIVPVSSIDGQVIGIGSIGPATKAIRSEYESRIEEFCSAV